MPTGVRAPGDPNPGDCQAHQRSDDRYGEPWANRTAAPPAGLQGREGHSTLADPGYHSEGLKRRQRQKVMGESKREKGGGAPTQPVITSTSRIREAVSRIVDSLPPDAPLEAARAARRQLTRKESKRVIQGALERHFTKEELVPYQAELIKLLQHLEVTGKKIIILFDGRDASGKGGTIRRVVRYLNEKHYRVVALGKPTEEQRTELHMKRYIEHFPHAGELVLFDRSWYNRAMVEPVMGFCTPRQYREFMRRVVGYEERILADGTTHLIKLYFSVSKDEQQRRFERRRNDPLRQWKLSEVDLQAQALWDEFTEKKYRLLQKTHTPESPWWIVRSDDKHLARRETLKLILKLNSYRGRSRKLGFEPDPRVVISGDQELKVMKAQRKKHGRFLG
ncbi:MAG: polyphosphate kinase 2 [bacterium]|nr:polyphosphate kinase 2 [bacterium]